MTLSSLQIPQTCLYKSGLSLKSVPKDLLFPRVVGEWRELLRGKARNQKAWFRSQCLNCLLQDQEKTGEWLRFKCWQPRFKELFYLSHAERRALFLFPFWGNASVFQLRITITKTCSRCSLLSVASRDRPVFVYCDFKWSLPPENLSCCSLRWGSITDVLNTSSGLSPHFYPSLKISKMKKHLPRLLEIGMICRLFSYHQWMQIVHLHLSKSTPSLAAHLKAHRPWQQKSQRWGCLIFNPVPTLSIGYPYLYSKALVSSHADFRSSDGQASGQLITFIKCCMTKGRLFWGGRNNTSLVHAKKLLLIEKYFWN